MKATATVNIPPPAPVPPPTFTLTVELTDAEAKTLRAVGGGLPVVGFRPALHDAISGSNHPGESAAAADNLLRKLLCEIKNAYDEAHRS